MQNRLNYIEFENKTIDFGSEVIAFFRLLQSLPQQLMTSNSLSPPSHETVQSALEALERVINRTARNHLCQDDVMLPSNVIEYIVRGLSVIRRNHSSTVDCFLDACPLVRVSVLIHWNIIAPRIVGLEILSVFYQQMETVRRVVSSLIEGIVDPQSEAIEGGFTLMHSVAMFDVVRRNDYNFETVMSSLRESFIIPFLQYLISDLTLRLLHQREVEAVSRFVVEIWKRFPNSLRSSLLTDLSADDVIRTMFTRCIPDLIQTLQPASCLNVLATSVSRRSFTIRRRRDLEAVLKWYSKCSLLFDTATGAGAQQSDAAGTLTSDVLSVQLLQQASTAIKVIVDNMTLERLRKVDLTIIGQCDPLVKNMFSQKMSSKT